MEIKNMSSIKKVSALSGKRRITGQGMTEYIIVVALIAIAAVASVSFFGEAVQAQFANIGEELIGNKGDATANVVEPKAKNLKDYVD
jgi:Flp pilus assembly pilin Flp